jgi:lysophospholipase
MATATENVSSRYLSKEKIAAIAVFWHTVEQNHFVAHDGIRINYAINNNRNNHACVVIVSGRSEGYLKYQELIFDLNTAGYNSVIIDHRGQGISQRLTENPHKGYVESFNDYVTDLHHLMSEVVPSCTPGSSKPFMLAHSMGGAIAIRYLQQHPEQIARAVLSSPMIAINAGDKPLWLAKALIKMGDNINQWLSNTPWYFIGQSDYGVTPFEDNALMHSQSRYQRFISLYNENDKLQLGGVTFHWLNESLKVNDDIFTNIAALSTPLLMLQAELDSIVDNQAQQKFCQQLNNYHSESCPKGQAKIIKGAFHELLFETDNIRDIAIDSTLTWFNQDSR